MEKKQLILESAPLFPDPRPLKKKPSAPAPQSLSPDLLARFGPPHLPAVALGPGLTWALGLAPHAGRRAMRAFPAYLLCRNPTPPKSFISILFKP